MTYLAPAKPRAFPLGLCSVYCCTKILTKCLATCSLSLRHPSLTAQQWPCLGIRVPCGAGPALAAMGLEGCVIGLKERAAQGIRMAPFHQDTVYSRLMQLGLERGRSAYVL